LTVALSALAATLEPAATTNIVIVVSHAVLSVTDVII
jgi:hypothetical protein